MYKSSGGGLPVNDRHRVIKREHLRHQNLKAYRVSSMFSILHLSDLHRSAAEPISNDTLIASLQADCDRFPMETPEIRRPDGMVVSGDIVFGESLGESNFGMAIKEQYKLAEEFLVGLTERLFEGFRQ